jgi:Flp pilus assembly protein TadG
MTTPAAMKTISRLPRALHHAGRRFIRDRGAMAATEFAFIVPLMLVLFFGTIDFSAGLAASRKVTLTSSALADLASEMPAAGNIAPIADSDLQNMFTAGISIMNPYMQNSTKPVKAWIYEIYVDSALNVTVQWSSEASFAASDSQATLVPSAPDTPPTLPTALPAALKVKQTYVVMSEVSYTFVPLSGGYAGLMSNGGVNFSDVAYSRPRQATCLVYNGNQPQPTAQGACPTP